MAVFKRYKGRRVQEDHPKWKRLTWSMEFTLRGRYVFKSIPGALTKAQAKRAEISIRESTYKGKFDQASEKFSTFVDETYLPWARDNKKSFAHDESRVKPLKDFFGMMELQEIRPRLIRNFKKSMLGTTTHRGTERKGITVNRYLQLLSKIFSLASEDELVESNPCKRVKKYTEGGRRERYLTHEEETRLMEVLTGDLSHLAPAVTLALETGMRKAELLGLRFEHINFGDSPVFHPVNGREMEIFPNSLLVVESKSGKPRKIPMSPEVRGTLIRMQRNSEGEQQVFSYSRNGITDMTIRKGFPKACKAAKVPYGQATAGGLVWHDLRHTFATRLREWGTHELDIMQLMGHATVKMTASYAHGTHRNLQDAVNKLATRKAGFVELNPPREAAKSRHRHVIGVKTAKWLNTEVTVTF